MPTRLRQTATTEVGQKENGYNIPGLQFGETLTWRAGKPIPVAELLARLQKLSAELRNYDLDEVDSRSFTTLAQDLANPNLLGHKDKGVRAWTVSCIVDVLKICAPDAPFQVGQLKDIFTVTINSILPALADPTNAYNAQHVYILTSLAESQSILLVTDVPNHENLIISLFTTAFDIVSGSGNNTSGVEVSKSVEYHLKNLLAAVVDEVPLPQEVTDIIISQFMRVDARNAQDHITKGRKRGIQDTKQATLLLKEYPPAYNMAKSLCTTCPEKMTAQITHYFGTIIVDATAATTAAPLSKSSHRRMSDLGDSDDEHEGLADLRKAHRLLRELWRACPDVLLNVIPQVEAEFSADSPALRRLATETIGDMTAGIGIAGLPPSNTLDPAVFPLPSLEEAEPAPQTTNPLLAPASPKPFATVHASAYSAFFGRRNDRAPGVREAWAVAASRILLTSAGAIGLNDRELLDLLAGFAQMLRDPDERVRLVTIQSVHAFSYHGILNTLAADGGLSKPGTVLATMVERVTDRKNDVRQEAIDLLARIWGVASRDVENGVEVVKAAVGDIPDRLLRAYYTNDLHVHAALDKALYESLLPLSFPPIKVHTSRTESQKPRAKDKEDNSSEGSASDPDAIRTRRILTLVQSLDTKSRLVFFKFQTRQVQMSKAMTVFLQACEEYNGGVVENDRDETTIKDRLTRYIDHLSKTFPDSTVVATDLWKFAKQHNRRWYQLIRFAMGPEHDYRTVIKAIKELGKRIREGPASSQSLLDTLQPILYRCALIVYNRSHVPTIMEISRSDEAGLGEVAHEVLKEISAGHPEVLKSHIQSLCRELEENAPSSTKAEEPGMAETLRACAGFARKYPADVPAERKFLTSLTHFALFSKSPRAAKHAVSIILLIADKKEMYAKDMLSKALKDCEPDSPHFLARLATISQVCLLAPAIANLHADAIQLVTSNVLERNRSSGSQNDPNAWDELPDDEIQSKELALKILVNRCRAQDEKSDDDGFAKSAKDAFDYLIALIRNEGEVAPSRDTPSAQKNRLRLVAAHFILKLCSHKRKCEEFVDASTFISIAMIMINPPNPVRTGFVNALKKYLGHNRLAHRWFTPLFLLAFEPDIELRTSVVNWIKGRVQFFARQQLQVKSADKKLHQNVMESIFARLLSLLAHHPDYPSQESEDFDGELLDFSKYIIFYLFAVSTEDNLSLIFHIAQRVKGARDGITGTEEASERLYVLSDLSQAVIRNYADLMPAHAKGVNLLQTWPGNVTLPRSLFKALPSHEAAQEIAEKNYLPEDVATGLEKLVRTYIKELKGASHSTRKAAGGEKKRKSEAIGLDDDGVGVDRKKVTKKPKKSTLPLRKTSKPKQRSSEPASPEMPSRKSARISNAVSYAEADSEDDDVEMAKMDEMTSRTASERKKSARIKSDVDEEGDEGDTLQSELHSERGDETDEANVSEGSEHEVRAHEDDVTENGGVGINGADVEMTEAAASSSPFKERPNAKGAEKGRGRGLKTSSAAKPTSAKETVELPGRRTRQTRSTRS
ncbi:hypothetical protein A1O1_07041 [Capronia coronata CBS 617.96]|uniref:Sister chromatid cohesion protein PDS5 n=1 Tax=Capronia coronata CBS 617.96 TaxID=1182541 RepID=W9XT85_9EURO|nr:uncharacterized protein A1O1_07041 [Capronia coronata CBS 617.96]EXJ83418.1 hypothetical protein A1O1_07041 [Capronia coronata CBS 617.96]